jgi:hypothetical protein
MKKYFSLIIIVAAFVLFGASQASAATFVVDSNSNLGDAVLDGTCATVGGVCTLQAAISEANNTVEVDTINFNAAMTITMGVTPLSIINPVIIDASSVSACPTPGVTITGSGITANLFLLSGNADGTTIRGFVLRNYTNYAIGMSGISGSTTTIACNTIGLNAAGTAAAGGISGISLTDTSNVMIGGATTADRNVLAGNQSTSSSEGIIINNGTIPTTDITIRNNYFSVNAAGTAPITNGSAGEGIEILTNSGSTLSNLTVTNNLFAGIGMTTNYVNGVIVKSNTFDLASDGVTVLPFAHGTNVTSIRFNVGGSNITIGGVGEGNVFASTSASISLGNSRAIYVNGATSVDILGNFIGVAADGNTPLFGSTSFGYGVGAISISNSASSNIRIGSAVTGEGNIALNKTGSSGFLVLIQSGTGIVIKGNRFGVTADGSTVSNGATAITMLGTSVITIGGTGAGEGNYIAGGSTAGIYTLMATVGGAQIIGNTIYNSAVGILASSSTGFGPDPSTYAAISRNSIYGTTGLGIDLVADTNSDFQPDAGSGEDTNDYLDADTGVNNKLNHPILVSAAQTGSDVVVTYLLDVPVSVNPYLIEFFNNPSGVSSTGFGPGQTYLASETRTISVAGPQLFSITLPNTTVATAYTATVTSCTNIGCTSYGFTSEFSNSIQGGAYGVDRGTASGNETSFANNGAYHIILSGYYLGTTVSTDTNDAADLTDKNGVILSGSSYAPSETAQISVSAVGSGYYAVWMDANANGSFQDSGELVVSLTAIANETKTATFTVPGAVGSYPIRVRYYATTPGTPSPIGEAIGGEVEDYVLVVGTPVVISSSGGGAIATGKVCNDIRAINYTNGLGFGDVSVCIYPNTSISTPTPSQSAAATQYVFPRTLKLGMNGNDVKLLQQYFNTHGFTIAVSGAGSPGKETTYFGPATLRAVIKFQEAHADQILKPLGLTKGTGLFGAATKALIK